MLARKEHLQTRRLIKNYAVCNDEHTVGNMVMADYKKCI